MAWRPMLVAFLIAAIAPAAFAEQRKNLRLSWPELGPVVEGRQVSLLLAGGTKAGGKVLGVEPDGLRLGAAWTTDSKLVIQRGKTLVPRSSVSVIRLRRYSKYWRLILTPGLPATLLFGMVVGVRSHGFAPDPRKIVVIGVGVTAGATFTGYYLGKWLDRRELTEITIVESGGTK